MFFVQYINAGSRPEYKFTEELFFWGNFEIYSHIIEFSKKKKKEKEKTSRNLN